MSYKILEKKPGIKSQVIKREMDRNSSFMVRNVFNGGFRFVAPFMFSSESEPVENNDENNRNNENE